MKVVFLGTPELGRTVLENLVSAGIEIPLVITQPDRVTQKRGRGDTESSPVGVWATKKKLTVLKPKKVIEVTDDIVTANPDVVVVAAYGQLVPDVVLETASGRWLNVHGSQLPRYRGASPVQQAILDGLDETGVTIMEVVSELDAGPIVSQQTVPIASNDTAGTLMQKVASAGGELLIKTLPQYVDGSIQPEPQDEAAATMTRTLSKKDGQVDWMRDAEYLERFVRAMQPWPGAHTIFEGQSVVILKVAIADKSDSATPGTFQEQAPLVISTGDGDLEIKELKPAGKSAMSGEAWLRGLRRGGRFVSA
ncbi:methionyl-tRNA formyltransferase [Patescibacteria group bacterium]|nr:methionyl-tRNA formyltransferase [Patescibacteria group bacterium]